MNYQRPLIINNSWDKKENYLAWDGIDRKSLKPWANDVLKMLYKLLDANLSLIVTTDQYGSTESEPIVDKKGMDFFFFRFQNLLEVRALDVQMYLSAASPVKPLEKGTALRTFTFQDEEHFAATVSNLDLMFLADCLVFVNNPRQTIAVIVNDGTKIDTMASSVCGRLTCNEPHFFVPIFGFGVEIYDMKPTPYGEQIEDPQFLPYGVYFLRNGI